MEQKIHNQKRKRIVIILIVVLLLILMATYVVYSYYTKNVASEALRNELWEKAKNNDLGFFFENDLYQNIIDRMEKDNFELASAISLSTTMQNKMFSELDLSKFQLNYQMLQDRNQNKNYHKLQTGYAGNDFITFDFIANQKQFAMKSDEIVNKYVGINTANFQKLVNQVYQSEVDLTDMKILKNLVIDREPIRSVKLQNFETYVALLEKEVMAENIAKKENVVVTINSDQISTTEYTISLDSQQVKHLLEGVSDVLERDDQIIPELVVSKVQNLEEDEKGILEYTDNDNMVEVPGQENNFNTSLQIWGENTTNVLNTIPANTTLETNNTVEMENTMPFENVVTNQIEENPVNEVNDLEQTPQEVEEPLPEVTEPVPEPEENLTEEQRPEPIEEEDNFRTQGYFEVNENPEDYSQDDTVFIIGENYEETLQNITNRIQNVNWITYLLTGAKANCTEETLKEEIQTILNERMKQNNRLVVKLYVSEGKTIKISFSFPETSESFDIEICSKADNEKYLNITSLKGEQDKANGSMLTIYIKKTDAVVTSRWNLNKITKSKISQKTTINLQTKGTINAKKYTIDIDASYSDAEGEFKVELGNSLNFDIVPEIPDLTNENCLFLDTLSNDELNANIEAIKQKTKEVLREKNRNLNIIDSNNSNLVVQQTEQNTAEDETAKTEAKNALISHISNQMRDYLNEGKELKIEDLENLAIPGYNVEISISSNLAIITVNGYKFKLDSEFNLSD